MEELLQSSGVPTIPKVGDVVKATVVSVSSNEIHLDIEGITTGIVRGRELIDESGTYIDLSEGDIVEATVLEMENEKGVMELSFRQAGHQKAWENLERLMKDEEVITVIITDANKGGLMAKVGNIEGFLPVSQLTVEHYPRVEGGDKNKILDKLREFTGKEMRVKIIDVDESESKLIVSEKAAWEEKQQEVISQYDVGDVVKGVVTGVVDFGAFIEFGDNLEGLVHISELAWQRIDDPNDFVHVGDEVEAKIISIDGSRISLSMKALKKDPWKEASEKYSIGQIVEGTVLKINPFGIFVELDKDIHGLAHISELSRDRISNPNEVVREGERYKFKILSIEPENHRLGLSLKGAKAKETAASTAPGEEKKPGENPAAESPETEPASDK